MNAARFALVYPMFALVVLSAIVLVTMFRRRVRAVRAGLLPGSFFRTYQGASEPESTIIAARHFSNLFEAPTLFYAACLAAMLTGATGTPMLALAWAYVAARVAHTFIHLGPNRLRWRVRAYALGWLILLAMWVGVVVAVAGR